jgi:ribonuclease P protein component
MYDFKSKNRLKSKQEFQSVFNNASKVSHRALLALHRTNSLPYARLGIVMSKHKVKFAVWRNQIKRLIRESFRHHRADLKGLDIIILLRSECNPLDKHALREQIDNLWHCLKPSSPIV